MAVSSTTNVFLTCMGFIYFFAFSSLYFQVPGLYGDNGLLPAKRHLKLHCHDGHPRCSEWTARGECTRNSQWMSKNCMASCEVCKKGDKLPLDVQFRGKPTLLLLGPALGLDTGTGMELICLIGAIMSLLMSVSSGKWHLQHGLLYLVLWILYFSLYQVGETFLYFQWDILLLEVGFLAVVVGRWSFKRSKAESSTAGIRLWLVKWLLFRLMFASGVVKLTSQCPTWWKLTALDYHYESQCIPTYLAWFAHQLPDWFQRLSVIITYIIEIGIPVLFFVPVRRLRLFSFYAQVFFQLLIILTGNYNFFNLLTMTLCLSLLDDKYVACHFKSSVSGHGSAPEPSTNPSRYLSVLGTTTTLILEVMSAVWIGRLFLVKDGQKMALGVAFSWDEFQSFLSWSVPWSIALGLMSLFIEIAKALCLSFKRHRKWGKIQAVFSSLIASFVALWLFSISLVPFTDVHQSTQSNLWPAIHKLHGNTHEYHITNSYGLFRRMTGVGGRPELVVEGSNSISGPWKEYEFLYKPGEPSRSLPFIVPHQPRLDWQMWFAALGSYQHNPWFLNLIYKLLHGEPDVLALMGDKPFPDNPPKFIRSTLYLYHYTKLPKNCSGVIDGLEKARKIKKWWRREKPSEYTPPLTKDDKSLQDALLQIGLLEKASPEPVVMNGLLQKGLVAIRNTSKTIDAGGFLVCSFFLILIVFFIKLPF